MDLTKVIKNDALKEDFVDAQAKASEPESDSTSSQDLESVTHSQFEEQKEKDKFKDKVNERKLQVEKAKLAKEIQSKIEESRFNAPQVKFSSLKAINEVKEVKSPRAPQHSMKSVGFNKSSTIIKPGSGFDMEKGLKAMKTSIKDYIPSLVIGDPGGLVKQVCSLNNEHAIGAGYGHENESDRGEGEPGVPIPDTAANIMLARTKKVKDPPVKVVKPKKKIVVINKVRRGSTMA